ncbi:heat shock 70 kDa protein 12A-like isoform X2 [Ruditapes philippinarum]|uniref:heat shock 70 kDa protein 12A-like isoform X2 n=1 Tax=Ruditapes philippinarum TaxID=129788 RepID=UPI00295BC163|nr:heat shock 70 kDa protein 12A-like isoform X2 [Ruditapes philippinarum]
MADLYSGTKREISYFGPIYINSKRVVLSGDDTERIKETKDKSLDINKYKIRSVDAIEKENVEQNNAQSRIDTSPMDKYNKELQHEIESRRHLAPYDKTLPRQQTDFNHTRSKSEDRTTGHALKSFRPLQGNGGHFIGQYDYRFKISSTEDNYMYDKFKAKSKLIHIKNENLESEQTTSNEPPMHAGKENISRDDDSKILTDLSVVSADKTNISNETKEAIVQTNGKDFLTKHRNRINKLKRRFFESQTTPKPIPVPNSSNASEKSKDEHTSSEHEPTSCGHTKDIVPAKPPRNYSNSERTVSKSRLSLLDNYDDIFSGDRRRRHSTDGALGINNLEEMRVRWSTNFGQYAVVVAIDFGTTYSGYAYSFMEDPETVHMMRRHESGDPGVYDQKIPTAILLSPEGDFHSFGYAARDFYHDLDQKESVKWMYFEKFKMMLHTEGLHEDSMLKSISGKESRAMKVFSLSLAHFKELALQEICDQSGEKISCDVIRWVITVPAIWKASAKQFMRKAAYQAGIVSENRPDQLLIALEPEAASIYCRRLRMFHILSEGRRSASVSMSDVSINTSLSMPELPCHDVSLVSNDLDIGTRYMVVDCGGGTVDITVHELLECGKLKELQRASGGSHGSVGVDEEFEKLLYTIFGADLINHFKKKRPSGWVDLMAMFESRKRTASPYRSSNIAISIPFSFIDFYKKTRGSSIASALKQYGDPEITWTANGLLKLSPGVMRRLFLPTVDRIKQSIGSVLNNPVNKDIMYMFLVGGFAESSIVQHEMRKDFGSILKIIIPPGVGMSILRGATYFGQDPHIVNSRCSCLTYGVGVLRRFDPDKHSEDKKVTKDGLDWCTDVFDVFVKVDQSVELGEKIFRRYTPVRRDQTATTINIYSTENENAEFITDPGVTQCGTLTLRLKDIDRGGPRREIRTEMTFGDTEIRVEAIDVAAGEGVEAKIDFINL